MCYAKSGSLKTGVAYVVYGGTPIARYLLRYKDKRVNAFNAGDLNGKGTVSYDASNNRILVSLDAIEYFGNYAVIDYYGTDAFTVKFSGYNRFYNGGSNSAYECFLRSRKVGVPCTISGDGENDTLRVQSYRLINVYGPSYNDVVRQIKGLVIEKVNLTNDTYGASKTSYGKSGKFTFERTGALLGDIDGNGLIEVNDVVLLADIAMGGSMGDVQMSIADMDGNGLIEVNDVVLLAGIAMGS